MVLPPHKLDIAACTGCVTCGYGGPCALSDDFDDLREQILSADMPVLTTPLYYYGMTAQLKAAIDRYCSANPRISGKRLKSALLAVAWNDEDWTFDALAAHYDALVHYLNLHNYAGVCTVEAAARPP